MRSTRFVVTGVKVVGKWDWAMKMKCVVCNLDIKKGETLLKCPYCGNISHKVHLLAWLHVKNTCPACNRRLSESEPQEFSLED
ncbi:MAG: RING finger domain-containing protein [Promethearchaeati archaeon SRVP18_Atabeyarchaeia-1]